VNGFTTALKLTLKLKLALTLTLIPGLAALIPNVASAMIELNGTPYLAATAFDDFLLQGGDIPGGGSSQALADIRTRAEQYCGYTDRDSRLVSYNLSRQAAIDFVSIGCGWAVQQVPYDMVQPFSENGLTGYARGFDYIRCR
jgi:hypothetical protein